jgi:CheY-like chemotaxis protein
MDSKNILLAEDDPQDVKMTLAALQESNLVNQVTVVRDGAEALDYLYRRGKFKMRGGGNPILLLLDNKMPKVSGLEVLKSIKADAHLKTIPVVALTSSRLTSDLTEFYLHGVNAYVVKSVDFPEFMKMIKSLGIFWTAVNEPPPATGRKEGGVQNGGPALPEKPAVSDQIGTLLPSKRS